MFSVVVVCTLASSASISVVSGLRFCLIVEVRTGGAGGVCAAERYVAWRKGEAGALPPRGRLVSCVWREGFFGGMMVESGGCVLMG